MSELPKASDTLKDEIAARFKLLPTPNPPAKHNTCVMTPIFDARLESGFMKGMMSSADLYAGWLELPGCSEISLARNKLLNQFLRFPQFEWGVFIDADISFKRRDFELLMEGTDYAVNGVYSKKDDTGTPVTQGLGFARFHRSLLIELMKLPDLCLPFVQKGELLYGFCFSGPTGVNNVYIGEDQAFWFMLSQLGVRARIENRVRLLHVGRAEYALGDLDTMPSELKQMQLGGESVYPSVGR